MNMKKKLAGLLAGLTMASTMTACDSVEYIYETVYYNCDYYYSFDYDYNDWYLYDQQCYYLNDDGQMEVKRDVVAATADQEELELRAASQFYAEKFQLADNQGERIARVIRDYNRLQNRSADDLSAFAERLYGMNTQELVSAVSKAQVGDNAALDGVISKAAANFQTSSDNMKNIVSYLHGKALKDAGIQLN